MGKLLSGKGLGWLPDYPDFRDFTLERKEASRRLIKLGEKESLAGMAKKWAWYPTKSQKFLFR